MRKMKFGTVLLIVFATCGACAAASYKVLHAFGNGSDGAGVEAGVTLDPEGNLYGTTAGGGAYGYGTVFKLVKKPDGRWAERLLHQFKNGDPDGYFPYGRVTLDGMGNIYSTTALGGAHNSGTAFELTPGPTGWSLTVLYSFCAQPGCGDGGSTEAGLALDQAGNLYGVSNVVYQLAPVPDGWTENVLYTFCSKPGCSDGVGTYADVILDDKGILYGTTFGGGAYDQGVVFKLKSMPDGTWTEHVLHSFGSFPEDGRQPSNGALALDSAGNLYGTTQDGGKYGPGTVFRLTRQPNGHWKETILHNFKAGKGGYFPDAGVVVDEAGNVYGTAGVGGDPDCKCGVAYRLAPNPDGTWTYTVLHRFNGYDGAFPAANLAFDDKGNLYGTTRYGSSGGGGVVFEITP
jgi:uncharacterized repeat protein (TIGR03803 family)